MPGLRLQRLRVLAEGVRVRVVRSMISEVRARGEPAAANDVKN